jgi:uncharacterized protein YqhQ
MDKKKSKASSSCRLPGVETIGGQAIVEGIMIRSPNAVAMAVRRKNGNLVIRSERLQSRPEKSIWRKPFFRGMAALGSALVLGIKAVNFSASIFEEDLLAEEEEKKKKKNAKKKKPKKPPKRKKEKKKKEGMSTFELVFSLVIALGMVIVLYKVIPLFIAGLLKEASPIFENTVAFNLVDAIVKTMILILVMWSMSLLNDVKRMYQYHGAEHMAVFNYEADKELNVRNALGFDTLHPRCGTNFLILVFVISLFFFLAIDPEWPFAWKLILRLLLLPAIAGVTYELLRFGSKKLDNFWIRMIMAPGIALQRITTKKPDRDQVAVAVIAVKEVLEREKSKAGKKKVFEISKAELEY